MPSNTEIRFSEIPYVEKQRSRFDRSCEHKTSWSTGDLIPIEISEVLPGDTITADFSHVTRMTTPIAPVMDHAAMDVYAFFVPNRLLWNHWKAFCGENEVTHWEEPNQYTIPQITAPSGGWDVGSLMDYMGIPTGVGNLSVNHLPVRAYCKIVNDWFRDENLKDPCNIENGDSTVTGVNYGVGYDYVTDLQKGAKPFKAAKWADYFTKALPEPQKGPDVKIPLGKTAPVIGGNYYTATGAIATYTDSDLLDNKIQFIQQSGGHLQLVGHDTETPTNNVLSNDEGIGLLTDLSEATAATINQLRQAFAIQRFYEAQARGGSRYIEFVANVFGVNSPDARQQRSEYLGGKRFPINMDQVLQTSATGATSPQGNTAAFSCTVNSDNLCTYSATEHGYFLVLGVIRTNHSYQQGIERMWSRKSFFDFYVPQLANIGEQEIRNKEIFAQGSNVVDSDGNVVDEQVFGYQEAWADYRYHPNRISGKLRSTATGSLDIWHYGDEYTSLPQLSSDWIDETEANVQRTLAVQNEPQFVSDFYIKSTWTRIMPLYSVPGLMDHH